MTPGAKVRIKICGITDPGDATAAVDAGADALGFIFYKKSPRYISPEEAEQIVIKLPPFVTAVGVFVDETDEEVNRIVKLARLGCAQLHGSETPVVCSRVEAKVIKALRVRDEKDIEGLRGYCVSAFLLDTFKEGVPGGTGETFDWDLAVAAKDLGPVILSGGLTPENVADAILKVRPYGVDVSSGVELSPGKKDHYNMRRFIEKARAACS